MVWFSSMLNGIIDITIDFKIIPFSLHVWLVLATCFSVSQQYSKLGQIMQIPFIPKMYLMEDTREYFLSNHNTVNRIVKLCKNCFLKTLTHHRKYQFIYNSVIVMTPSEIWQENASVLLQEMERSLQATSSRQLQLHHSAGCNTHTPRNPLKLPYVC